MNRRFSSVAHGVAARLVFALTAAVAIGCTPLEMPSNWQWPELGDLPGIESKSQTPDRMAVFWWDAVRRRPGTKPVRGFGARIMFYAKDQREPIEVDGTLTAYVFDEEAVGSKKTKPIAKYQFPPEMLEKLYSESDLGHSYSIFVPHDEVGGPQKELCLICRFEGQEGAFFLSHPETKTLIGFDPDERENSLQIEKYKKEFISGRPRSITTGVQQVAYEERLSGHEERVQEDNEVSVMTLNATPNLTSQLMQGAAQDGFSRASSSSSSITTDETAGGTTESERSAASSDRAKAPSGGPNDPSATQQRENSARNALRARGWRSAPEDVSHSPIEQFRAKQLDRLPSPRQRVLAFGGVHSLGPARTRSSGSDAPATGPQSLDPSTTPMSY